jgi:hypothetical protein
MGKTRYSNEERPRKAASAAAKKEWKKRQSSAKRKKNLLMSVGCRGGRDMTKLRQLGFSDQAVRFRCKVCMKNFASEYYLDVHHRKVRCKKTSVTLTSGIEYLILNTEGYEDNWEPLNSPEMISSSNTNTYIRISSHIYVLLYNICVLHI